MSHCFYFKLCALIRLQPGRGFNVQCGITVRFVHCDKQWTAMQHRVLLLLQEKEKPHRYTRNYLIALIAHYS